MGKIEYEYFVSDDGRFMCSEIDTELDIELSCFEVSEDDYLRALYSLD